MSDKDRPEADDGGGSGRADEEDTEGPAESDREGLCKGCGRKGRRLSFFRLRKSKKLLHQKRKKKGIFVNSSRGWGRRANGGGGGWCLCLRQPKTLDSSGESPTSDPNSSEFSVDMLRALLEKNDFYSKECNPHLDAARKPNDQN